jgi:hypothetical protein
MSIFYMVVNIGSFTGKGLAAELNVHLGLKYINFYAAGMSFVALLLVTFFYRNVDTEGVGKTLGQALRGLVKVMFHFRFLSLILIIAGFWLIQGQLYGAMPTYIERVLGRGYRPEWLANINPLTVVLLVIPITHLVRNFRPENAIGIGLLIIPFTALVIAVGAVWQDQTGIPGILIGMICLGIALQGLAECFLSPKFLEYASKQAPKGEVGLYLGYQHLTTFFAWLAGFIAAGLLLDAYCPDPRTLEPERRHEWRLATIPTYRFALPDALEDQLRAGAPVTPPVREVFGEEGVDLPPDATLQATEAEHEWQISAGERTFTIEEFALETEAGARAAGRAEPRSDLLVHVDQPRAGDATFELPPEYAQAHYIWYAFAGVGFAAFGALLVFKFVTGAIDKRREAAGVPPDAGP